MTERVYTNAAQTRGYEVLKALAGHEFMGMSPGEIAKAVGTSNDNITRDLRVLQASGLAEPILETGRWRLGPKLVQIALAFMHHIERSQRQLNDINQRYSRQPD